MTRRAESEKRLPKVLVVDEDPPLIELYKFMFGIAGINDVNSARSSSEALSLLQDPNNRPDLITLELHLDTQLSGFHLLRELKREGSPFKDIPVFVITSVTDRKLEMASLKLGACAYRTKPFDTHRVLRSIDRILGIGDKQ